ncbi:hypothetical protein VNO77_39063 [Canavalia gladiata]|uniref:Uncharacterized protein n=1 Tax=Canavalia gladiata TaxID=3824 RepID=A0AAN9KBZ7_CANGL
MPERSFGMLQRDREKSREAKRNPQKNASEKEDPRSSESVPPPPPNKLKPPRYRNRCSYYDLSCFCCVHSNVMVDQSTVKSLATKLIIG